MLDDYIRRVSWSDVDCYLNNVAKRVDRSGFSGIYGIPRGGSVLGAWLAHKLYLPMLFKLESNCVIIDDIHNGGGALQYLLTEVANIDIDSCFITAMFYNPSSKFKLDYFYKEKDDNWIVFPWEQ